MSVITCWDVCAGRGGLPRHGPFRVSEEALAGYGGMTRACVGVVYMHVCEIDVHELLLLLIVSRHSPASP